MFANVKGTLDDLGAIRKGRPPEATGFDEVLRKRTGERVGGGG